MSDMNKEAKCETSGEVLAYGHQVTSMAGGVFAVAKGTGVRPPGATGGEGAVGTNRNEGSSRSG